ncbi:MAG: T9SS type A sorting domain-containing protein [Flavobacteriales bacterium]
MQNWIQRCVLVGLFGAFAGGFWGQATIVDAPDTIYVALDTLSGSGAVEAHWTVANNTDSPLSLMVTRNLIDTVSPFNYPYQSGDPGAFERFCWGPTCFNYGTDSSPANAAFFVNLNSGLSDDSFRSDYYPNGVVGSTTLEYCFHEEGALAFGACHQITFVSVATASVEALSRKTPSIDRLSPNPATDLLTVTWNNAETGVLEFRNLVGQVVKTEQVLGGVSSQHVNLDGLSDGIWLVSYKVGGVAVSTKRLVLR